MGQLIIQPTSLADWQSLIKEAENASHHSLAEDLESYLVFLLMRFTSRAEVANSVLAREFLQSLKLIGQEKVEHLREVGDKCLLFAGLFPGRAERRRVQISYFVELGQNAYAHLATTLNKQKLAELYLALHDGFVTLMDVLHTVREINNNTNSLTPLQAAELWTDTASSHALTTLRHYTAALPIFIKSSGSRH